MARRNTTPVACGHADVQPGCAECEPAPPAVHARLLGDHTHMSSFLCGTTDRRERATRPKEYVTCPTCEAMLKALADRYPERFDFRDMRQTAQERRDTAASFVADMYGGADD